MIHTKDSLLEYIEADRVAMKMKRGGYFSRLKEWLYCTPISDQRYIWRYIKTLRYVEYYTNNLNIINKVYRCYYLLLLKRLSYKTGFQIPPNTCGKGLAIFHWGTIIINSVILFERGRSKQSPGEKRDEEFPDKDRNPVLRGSFPGRSCGMPVFIGKD